MHIPSKPHLTGDDIAGVAREQWVWSLIFELLSVLTVSPPMRRLEGGEYGPSDGPTSACISLCRPEWSK